MNDPPRPYTLAFEQRDEYLYVRVTAEGLDRESAVDYIREIADKCREQHCKRVMIERDIEHLLSHADFFFVCQQVADIMRGIRIAFINRKPAKNDVLAFALLVLRNRGARAEIHESVGSAERFLLR